MCTAASSGRSQTEERHLLVTEYDSERVIVFSAHVGGLLSDADVDGIVASLDRAMADAGRKDVPVTLLVLVESGQSPTAVQRKRLGEATARIKRGHAAFVVRSPLLRAVITAVGWFRHEIRENQQSTHGSYESARKWLAAHSGYPESVFDAMNHAVRSRTRLERAS